ncbi:thiamine pyrophosphate-binding protein [Burkholderia sp. PAMC 28687]|uniref:thiamine pyrophosphate-binding protein n=1 Tax=Burkholderia sp. PAMC 28687 TaxID=1795874 RepID=UPI003FA48CB4
MKASDLFVKALENEGVDRIFAVPGEENLDVVESLRRSSIQLILTRHEQTAAFMAATHGRLTRKPGVCMATLGPGALNLVTGAAYARRWHRRARQRHVQDLVCALLSHAQRQHAAAR